MNFMDMNLIIIRTKNSELEEFKSKKYDVEAWLKGFSPDGILLNSCVRHYDITNKDIKDYGSYEEAIGMLIYKIGKEGRELNSVGRGKRWVIKKTFGVVTPLIKVEPKYEILLSGD